MQSIIKVDNIDVYLEGQGDTVLLMIHGWPDTYKLWDKQVACFKAHFVTARFTLPGFDATKGKRPMSLAQISALIGQIVDAISPNKPVVLMLHDWGCVFGYHYYQQQPQRVLKLIGVDIGDAFSPDHVKGLKLHEIAMLLGYQSTLAIMWQINTGLATWVTKGMAKALRYPLHRQEVNVGMNYPYAMAMLQRYGGLRQIKPLVAECPFYYAYARKKPLMFHSRAWLDKVGRRMGNQVQAYHAGHWLMVEQAELFNHNVAEWLGLPQQANNH